MIGRGARYAGAVIQVCSRCGTRWNVRDRRRAWCPRCNGALWAPLTEAQEAALRWQQAPAPAAPARPPGQPPRLAPGYRWIAVRPGPPPPPRPRRRPLGPTPRYTAIPRWGLMDYWRYPVPTAPTASAVPAPGQRTGPAPTSIHRMLVATAAALALAALTQALIYLLLLVNRTRLLNPVLAGGAVALSALASVVAVAMVIGCAVQLTRWLIARRSVTFTGQQLPETRPAWALWAGCLVPVVNLAWAPTYVIELAAREDRFARLRKPITVWWLLWAASTAASVVATVTGWAQDAQGIANNTVAMMLAYLLGAAAVMAAGRVFTGFERRAVGRPAHHWVVIADGSSAPHTGTKAEHGTGAKAEHNSEAATPPAELEPDGREPAA